MKLLLLLLPLNILIVGQTPGQLPETHLDNAIVATIFDLMSWKGEKIEIYESSKNAHGGEKAFMYVPKYSFSYKRTISRDSNHRVVINLEVSQPRKSELASFIGKKTGGWVKENSIFPVTIHSLELDDYEFGVTANIDNLSGGKLTGSQSVVFVFTEKKLADKFVDYLPEAEMKLTIRINKVFGSAMCDFKSIGGDIISSETFRKFISPVEGQKISLDKVQRISQRLSQELATNRICTGNDKEFFYSFNQLISELIFPQINKQLPMESSSRAVEDFNNERYKASVLNRIMTDASTTSQNEWDKQWGRHLIKSVEKDKRKKLEFGKTFKIPIKKLQLFSKFDFKSDRSRKLIENYDDDEFLRDGGKNLFEQLYKIEIEGAFYQPPSIFSNENIYSKNNLDQRFESSDIGRGQEISPLYQIVKMKK